MCPGSTVLNVGGGSRKIPLPAHYAGWEQVLLDIQAGEGVDIVCDGRELGRFAGGRYDAVYCSHNLEHYHLHEVPQVLGSFLHVLRSDGFAEIRVPDIGAVIHAIAENNLTLHAELYRAPAGPISVHDVIYGFGRQIERSGNPFYAHKCGFTPDSLVLALKQAGFGEVWVLPPLSEFEARAVAFKQAASESQRQLLGITA